MTEIEIEAVSELTATLVDSIAALIPQLSSSAAAPREEDLQRVVGSSAITLFGGKGG
jgi:hypothetical protein